MGDALPVRLSGPHPGYELLFNELYERIRSGALTPGMQIPSERELCDRYSVSRTMVRQALMKAERHGLLVRIPGKGTFVSHPHVQQDLGEMNSFTSTLAEHDLKPDRRVLKSQWEAVPARIAEKLGIATGEMVLSVETVGLGDGRPMALYHAHLRQPAAEAVARALESDGSASTAATYELAAAVLKCSALEADQTFEAVQVDASSAVLLQVPVGAAAFRVNTVFRTPERVPVETRVALYPGDRYTFHIVRPLRLD